jgi:L-cysteine S-thiosulfotransferase
MRTPGSRRSRTRRSVDVAAAIAACAVLLGGAAPLVAYRIDGDSIAAPLTGHPGDPARGREIVINRQVSACLLCHSGPFPDPHLQGSVAPPLDGVGSRLTAGQIRLRLVDPRQLNPDTIMPAYYVVDGLNRVGLAWQGRPILTAEQIEDVVAFLTSLRSP